MSDIRSLLSRSIFPRLNCADYLARPEYAASIDTLLESGGVGGFVLFEGDLDEVRRTVERVRSIGGDDLVISADCEDGVTQRFPGGTEFPSMMALGSANDVAATYAVARSIAREVRSLGIDWNFAPDADINTNPDNPIINIRSFGSTPSLVASHVHAYVRGMQDGGVVACAKHFPGHGDTSVDSHIELPRLDADRARLDSIELVPFVEAIKAGVRSVMAAHIVLPAIDPSGAPATLSRPVVTGLLRGSLGFDGVVVTDALDMHAITKHYGSGDAACKAYSAGCDALIIPADPVEALDRLVRAADDGDIDVARIERSAGRLAAMRQWTKSFSDEGSGTTYRHDVIALEAARRALKTTGHVRKLYPPLFVVAFVDTADSPKPDEWFAYFSSWYQGEAAGAIVPPDLSDQDRAEILANIDGAGSVLAAVFVRPRGFAGTIGLSEAQSEVMARATGKQLVVLNFGSPYLLTDVESNARVDAFSASSASLAVSIEALNAVIG